MKPRGGRRHLENSLSLRARSSKYGSAYSAFIRYLKVRYLKVKYLSHRVNPLADVTIVINKLGKRFRKVPVVMKQAPHRPSELPVCPTLKK